jgi:DMSO/TMAO reductase YedYZ molybdopterin-dependent catalytic subunit
MIGRRRFIATSASGLLLGGCDRLTNSERFRDVLRSAERLTMASQRLISSRDALARQYGEADLSPIFRSNGTRMPGGDEYARHLGEQFANWRLTVDGLVARPLSIPLPTLRSLPHRTQITRHDCVEGWSAIGKWHGVQLSKILDAAGLSTRANYIIFHCADHFGDWPYYESIDLIDAFHPQTILAWAMNGHLLPVANGAPLRLRVERQLGYKHAKYI